VFLLSASRTEKEKGLRVRCLTSFLFQVCLLGYVLVGWLQAGDGSAQLLGVAAGINLAMYALVRFGPDSLLPLTHRGAPLVGVALWAGLNYLGGGSDVSLFLAGFWFEILLSTVSHSVFGIVSITLASAIAYVAQQYFLGFSDALDTMILKLTSLAIVGGGASWVRRSWVLRQERFSKELNAQQQRLEAIEEKLADAQTLADFGAQTARIGHGLKNAVHSLRGFSTLVERGIQRENGESTNGKAALAGLKNSIDQLEELALDTLRPRGPEPPEKQNGTAVPEADSDLREILEAEVAEMAQVYPFVHCRIHWEKDEDVRVAGRVLREVLSNLLLNAAESMNRTGQVSVEVLKVTVGHEIRVSDNGPGVPPEIRDKIFRPGHSTKSNGHGMGLYLSRSLVESLGGSLSLCTSDVGTSFRIALPNTRVG